jgi:peptide deformylase
MLNPEVVETGEESSEYWEGCLSLPLCSNAGVKSYQGGKVSRPDKITVKYLTDAGEEVTETFTEFTAHIVGHELAHLRGEFYVDLLSPLQRRIVMRKFQRFKERFEVA